jgi:hypothetical protein
MYLSDTLEALSNGEVVDTKSLHDQTGSTGPHDPAIADADEAHRVVDLG